MKKNGFTLIELLVVIAIIGLLSSVVLASLNSARASARDARRATDMTQFKAALELYYQGNGAYPPRTQDGDCSGDYAANCAENLTNDLTPTYISGIPLDPLYGDDYTYGYLYWSEDDGSAFRLLRWSERLETYCKSQVQAPADVWGAQPECS